MAAASAASANGTQSSKKRKATSQASQSATTNTPKASTAATPPLNDGYSATNMMSFNNCGGLPKDRRLISDDGVSLEPNGNYRRFFD